jgi:hypothetical protein
MADFGDDQPIRIGLYNHLVDSNKVIRGNNITPELRTMDIEQERQRIHALGPKNVSEIVILENPVLYKYFQFEDNWGNIWGVTEYHYTELNQYK